MKPVGRKTQESVSNFIEKTYNILDGDENSQVVAWTPRGTSFIIKDVKKFQELILPIYFKHSNFSSFVRQLNMYNFHKVRGDRLDCQFEHEKFKRGQRDLLSKIKRKQSESFIVSQNLIDEYPANFSMQDSSENLKKSAEVPINFDSAAKDQYKQQNVIKSQNSFQELENLRKENKSLKMAKQVKMQKQKTLNTANNTQIGQKFFKLITCLLAQKMQRELRIDKPSLTIQGDDNGKSMSFDQIIEHVLNNGEPAMQFVKYSMTAKTINSQQSDCDFMLRKASQTSQVIGINRAAVGSFDSI